VIAIMPSANHPALLRLPRTRKSVADSRRVQFVRPAGASGRLLGDDWLARVIESGRRVHGPTV
jgi:hypothetical protein